MDVGYAPLTGVVLPHFETGDRVAAGDTVVTIVDAIACSRTTIRARGSGILFALKAGGSLALKGQAVFRIAGSTRLGPGHGLSNLLSGNSARD
jgi:predicted deacylase